MTEKTNGIPAAVRLHEALAAAGLPVAGVGRYRKPAHSAWIGENRPTRIRRRKRSPSWQALTLRHRRWSAWRRPGLGCSD